MNMKFDTANRDFRFLMGSGLQYTVPMFQRNYSWTEENWEDLWQDLHAMENDEQHYMGYLVLQTSDDRSFKVIDGQQRLTTVSILILAILARLNDLINKNIEPEANKTRLETLKNSYIGFTDPVSLRSELKLTLNQNNNAFYQGYSSTFRPPPQRGLSSSDRLLSQAYNYFYDRANAEEIDQNGESLAQYIEDLVNKLLFTVITVGDDLNAYKVFETLNARGVQLSVPDLLKNYLYSIIAGTAQIHESELNHLDTQWKGILNQLKETDFSRFVRVDWLSNNPVISQKQLFKQIKNSITTREQAYDYIRRLEDSVQIYAALHDEHDEFWHRDIYNGVKPYLKIFSLFNIRQPDALLIAAYKALDAEKFVKVAGYLAMLSMRYNVIGSLQANDQEKAYNKIARDLANGAVRNLKGVKQGLRPIYPDDDAFKGYFLQKQFPTKQTHKKARFILAQLESQASGAHVNDEELTLEHILPENPDSNWRAAFGERVEESTGLLGNLTLLPPLANKELRRAPFTEKKEHFSESTLEITKKVADYESWTVNTVLSRQEWLYELARHKWRIDFD